METSVRECRREDLGQVAQIFREAYSKPPYDLDWSEKNARSKVIEHFHGDTILVADTGDGVAGFIVFRAALWGEADHGYIVEFAVASDLQGQGVGSSLLEAAENALTERGVTEIELVDVNTNAEACEFYKHRGYDVTDLVRMKKPVH